MILYEDTIRKICDKFGFLFEKEPGRPANRYYILCKSPIFSAKAWEEFGSNINCILVLDYCEDFNGAYVIKEYYISLGPCMFKNDQLYFRWSKNQSSYVDDYIKLNKIRMEKYIQNINIPTNSDDIMKYFSDIKKAVERAELYQKEDLVYRKKKELDKDFSDGLQ